ncbi:MAG: class I SAM-dependent methyltransferase [Chlamydiales bacterium]
MICRICHQKCTPLFFKTQLNKYRVQFFRCQECESAQTESPYWLEEAYQECSYALDTGMVARTILTARLTIALALVKQFKPGDVCLDIGGGTGMFTRMLRDAGLNAYWSDQFGENVFAIGFEKELSEVNQPKLLTAFEVFEHFSEPSKEVSKLLETQPSFLLFSTELYQGEDQNWWYFLPNGQHVQFYSKKGLEVLAKRHGYFVQSTGNRFHLFSRTPESPKFLKNLLKISSKIEKRAKGKWLPRTEIDHRYIREKYSGERL